MGAFVAFVAFVAVLLRVRKMGEIAIVKLGHPNLPFRARPASTRCGVGADKAAARDT
jgi:hypothetical protein